MQSVGLKIQVDGEAEFRKSIKDINAEAKKLDSELKLVAAQFKNSGDSQDNLTKKQDVLRQAIENQQKAIDEYTARLEEASSQEDVSATYLADLETKLNKAKTAQLNFKTQLEESEQPLDETAEGIEEVASAADSGGDSALKMGDIIKANLISDIIVGGVKKLAEAFVAVGSAIKDGFSESVKWADDLNTLSIQTGIGTDRLQEFQYMAGLVDTPVETITGSLRKLTKSMSSASDGTGSAAEHFSSLGVSVTDADGNLRNSYDVFVDIIDALGQMSNETERDAAAMDIFGRSAQELNPLIETGSTGIAQYAEEARAMGYVLGGDTIAKLNGVADAQDRLNNAVDMIKREGSAALAPFVESLTNSAIPKLIEFSDGLNSLFSGEVSIGDFIEGIANSLAEDSEGFTALAEKIISALISGFKSAPNIINAAGELIKNLANGLKENAGENGAALGEGVGETISSLADNFASLAEPVSRLAVEFTTQFCISVARELPSILFSTIKGVFLGTGGALDGLFDGIGFGVDGGFVADVADVEGIDLSAYQAIGQKAAEQYANGIEGNDAPKNASEEMATGAVEEVTSVTSQGSTWGADMCDGIAEGINSHSYKVIEAAQALASGIDAYLGFSCPDVGPLSKYETWMPDFIHGMAKGIRNNSYILEDAIAGMAGGMSSAMSGSGSGGTVVNLTVTDPSPAYMDYMFNRFNVRLGGVL